MALVSIDMHKRQKLLNHQAINDRKTRNTSQPEKNLQ